MHLLRSQHVEFHMAKCAFPASSFARHKVRGFREKWPFLVGNYGLICILGEREHLNKTSNVMLEEVLSEYRDNGPHDCFSAQK